MSRITTFLNSDMFYRFRRDPMAVVSFTIIFIFVAMAALAPVIAPFDPYDPSTIDIMDSDMAPVWQDDSEDFETDERFFLGTDVQGRDLWSGMLYGTRTSLLIGFFAVLVQATLGISIGLISGYVGGRVESFFMRLADIQLSLSTLMVAIITLALFQAAFGTELYSQLAIYMLIAVIGIAEWPQYARTVRASVLAERKKEYVDAARVIGLGPIRIMVRHILPNTLSPIMVISTVQVANAIMSEAALSFLGLGMPVNKPSLGSLINSGFEYIFSGSWWVTAFPAIGLIVLILSINLLGDWLRDELNPRLYKD